MNTNNRRKWARWHKKSNYVCLHCGARLEHTIKGHNRNGLPIPAFYCIVCRRDFGKALVEQHNIGVIHTD
jgi:hypothetical protein